MWVKSQDGKLFNLETAYSVRLEDRGEHFVVVAEYTPSDIRSFNLTLRAPQDVAQAALDEIENALSEKRALLNLKREV